jgi:tetratricopeptide (TPR) repeat protein
MTSTMRQDQTKQLANLQSNVAARSQESVDNRKDSHGTTADDGETEFGPDFVPDSSLLLSLQERTLKEHICGAKTPEIGLRTPLFLSHFDIFSTCVEVLCDADEVEENHKQSARLTLQKYATENWFKHFLELFEPESDDAEAEARINPLATEEQIIAVAEGIYRITSNQNDVLKLILQYSDACYDDLRESGPKPVKLWLERALKVTEFKMNQETTTWAQEIILDPSRILQPLTRGHVVHWFSQISDEDVKKAFKSALKAFKTVGHSMMAVILRANVENKRNKWATRPQVKDGPKDSAVRDEAIKVTGSDTDDELDDEKGQMDDEKLKDVLALSTAFRDIEKGPNSHRATGVILMDLATGDSMTAASDELAESYKRCKTDEETFYTLITWAILLSRQELEEDAVESITTAFGLSPPNSTEAGKLFIQLGLAFRADLESKHNMEEKAVETLEEAMAVHSSNASTFFAGILGLLDKIGQHEKILEKVEKFGSVRLAISKEDWDDVNRIYQKAAQLTGKQSDMIATYERLVQQLESLNWASPTRYQLAIAYRRSNGNILKARSLLYEILDSENCIDPATNTVSDTIPPLARRELAEIIFEEFCTASTLKEKETLLKEIEGLPERRLGKTFSDEDLESDPDSTLRARMYHKLGPRAKFQETLDKTFLSCVASLQDENPWNDQPTLRRLCDVLSCLSGLEKEAAIAISSQFYVLDNELVKKVEEELSRFHSGPDGDYFLEPKSEEEKETDGTDDKDQETSEPESPEPEEPKREEENETDGTDDEDQETSEPKSPEPEYDIAQLLSIPCSGNCTDCPGGFNNWDKPLYKCVICANVDWCEQCYEKRQSGSRNEDTWRPYCGPRHVHVKAPVPGWKGIKDGIVCIDGEELFEFKKWLQEIKEVKWPQAWREFWAGA